MAMNRIPLKIRLERIAKGYAGDPAFVTHAIQSMADIPISIYLGTFPEEKKKLMDLLGIHEMAAEKMTYRETASYIQRIRMLPGKQEDMDKAVDILAMPLRKCYEERKTAYGKSAADTP